MTDEGLPNWVKHGSNPAHKRRRAPVSLLSKTNCLKLLRLRQATPCSPTLIRLAALSTFPGGEGMNGAQMGMDKFRIPFAISCGAV